MFIRAYLLLLATLLLSLPAKAQINPRLLAAIKRNDVRAVEAALKAGANPNATDSLGATPLMWACFKADISVMKLLVQRGAKTACKGVIQTDTDTYGNLTGLAAGFNKLSLLRYLIDTLKIPINQPEYNPETGKNDGWTPAEWAAINGNLDVLAYIDSHSSSQGRSAILTASINANLGDYYRGTGQYEKALPLYIQAKSTRERLQSKNHPGYAAVLSNLASLYERMGLYEKALGLYEEASRIYKKTLGKDHLSYATTLHNLATLYELMGQYAKAEPLYLDDLAITEKALGKSHPGYAITLGNLANLYESTGQYAKAEPLYLACLTIMEKALGKSHPNYAVPLDNLATLYRSMGQYAKAEPLYLDDLAITEKALGKSHPGYATSLGNLATLYKLMGQYAKAEPLYLEDLAITEKALGKSHPGYAATLNNLATLYESMGQYAKAEPLFFQARQQYRSQLLSQIAILNETALAEYQTEFNKQHFAYSLSYISYSQAMSGEHYTDALLSKGIGLMATQQLNNLLTLTKDSTTARIANQMRATKQRLYQQHTQPLSKQQSVDSLQREATALEQQLVLRLPEYGRAFEALRVEWQQVQQHLKPDEVAIEFVSFKYYHKKATDSTLYAALVLRPGWSAPRFVYLSEQRQLDSLLTASEASPATINGLYRGGKAEGNSSQLAKGVALSNLIWQPLDSLLQGVKTVFVAPAGRLHQIALAALPNPADTSHRTCMADRFQIRQVGSTRLVALRNTRSEQPLVTQTLKASLYGGITYDTDSLALIRQTRQKTAQHALALREATRSGEWNYLPGTQTEVDNLRQLLPPAQTTYLVNEAATEASVKALSGQAPTILHIATHGFFFPDLARATSGESGGERERTQFEVSENPLLRSGLVMAGANYVWKGGTPIEGVDDGILTAYEVSNLDLRGTELVVLSACETALGKVQGSEGVYGLQRAFKMAGARYLLMSLWRVSDQETADYMALFYRHMLETGSVATAYEYAQKQMRSRFPNEPFKWAGFVLVE